MAAGRNRLPRRAITAMPAGRHIKFRAALQRAYAGCDHSWERCILAAVLRTAGWPA
jgi:hypothetical protein